MNELRRPLTALVVATTLALALIGTTVTATIAGAARPADAPRIHVPRPTVSGPVTGGGGVIAINTQIAEMPQFGYVQDEYFFSGTAQAFDAVGTLGSDGHWNVAPSTTAPYKTRMIIRRPSDPARFNGTVIVEWLNVTAQFDTSPDWEYSRIELMRQGYAWVGISAQFIGVDGPVAGLKLLDPVRYGSLVHPGDAYSYDIYSQAARALTHPRGVDPLPGLDAHRLIADGESQSASRMTTYVNAIAPGARLYDAYLIHSRSAGASALSATGTGATMPTPTFIRTDLRAPVLVFESETDIPRYAPARQPDTSMLRTWEVAGTAHADEYMIGPVATSVLGCTLPANRGPQHYVFHTALRDLRQWMLKSSRVPPTAPRITLDATGNVARDADGNALGGIRTPQLDAPIATFSGFGNSPGLCSLFGTTFPFTADQLRAHYGARDGYLMQFLVAEAHALDARFLLADDAFPILGEAINFSYPA